MVGALALSAGLLAGTAGCVWGGDRKVSEQKELQDNIALQRESALKFRDEWQPNVEKIHFTREGDRPGLGASWRADAVATIAGRDYEVIISPTLGPGFPKGDVPPEAPRPHVAVPLEVVYSDGTSEVIQ
jgi:hypothetical protein